MNKIIKNFKNIKYGPAPEDDTEVINWINKISSPNKNYINGKWNTSRGSKKIKVINPSTNKKLFNLTISTKKDVDLAVNSAKKAQKKWSSISPFQRSKYLYALARLIQKHSRFLAVLESIDNGKPIRETRDIDIPLVARHFYYHAGWAEKLDKTSMVAKQISNRGGILYCTNLDERVLIGGKAVLYMKGVIEIT